MPLDEHDCTPFPELAHCFVPGVHDPTQAPFTHAWLVQVPLLAHAPVALQFCGCCPVHCTCPGAHTPVQRPVLFTHVWFEHAEPLFCQVPVVSHFCGCWPLHCPLPGAQDPVHTPLWQAWFTQGTGAAQLPGAAAGLHAACPSTACYPRSTCPVHTPFEQVELVHS